MSKGQYGTADNRLKKKIGHLLAGTRRRARSSTAAWSSYPRHPDEQPHNPAALTNRGSHSTPTDTQIRASSTATKARQIPLARRKQTNLVARRRRRRGGQGRMRELATGSLRLAIAAGRSEAAEEAPHHPPLLLLLHRPAAARPGFRSLRLRGGGAEPRLVAAAERRRF